MNKGGKKRVNKSNQWPTRNQRLVDYARHPTNESKPKQKPCQLTCPFFHRLWLQLFIFTIISLLNSVIISKDFIDQLRICFILKKHGLIDRY